MVYMTARESQGGHRRDWIEVEKMGFKAPCHRYLKSFVARKRRQNEFANDDVRPCLAGSRRSLWLLPKDNDCTPTDMELHGSPLDAGSTSVSANLAGVDLRLTPLYHAHPDRTCCPRSRRLLISGSDRARRAVPRMRRSIEPSRHPSCWSPTRTASVPVRCW